MSFRTPARPVDIEETFPELAALRLDTVRLHPRPGRPTAADSSVGGPLRWPEGEPWPVCEEPHFGIASATPVEDEVPMVPIVQVWRRDAPGLPFPEGRDLLQVLWCPLDHEELECPRPQVFWRDSATAGTMRAAPALPAAAEPEYIPSPCLVHPEQVAEYPSWDLQLHPRLRGALRPRFEQLTADTGWQYQYHLSTAPGIKLGGYPGWSTDPVWPDCASCGQRMEHLLTVPSSEYDGESWRTWLPLEERTAPAIQADSYYPTDRLEPVGVHIGRSGGVYIFECRRCPDRPIAHEHD
ncbi:Uncharacterised protein [Nocardia otitidiscaviarum]|uniref:DUF1963 domain-containing protein n=1 Tax=Nocardia otitidiscaviarum TaxID=1823 RepID=A0A378YTF4_9NOCA|nr:hypothetical protein [Nocardia otitidiscaviarum]SUA79820.1 Uncharacterised protein [Nocardia otitidiscaviarum]